MNWIELNGLNWIEWIELNWVELNWIELTWMKLNELSWLELNWTELNCMNWIELSWIVLNRIQFNWIESFVFTSSPFTFGGMSRTKLRFWKLADARNVVFCWAIRVSEDGWGSLSGGRVRIMVGSAAQWNCQFRLHFHNLNLQNLKEVSHKSFIFTSSTFSDFEGSLARKLCFHIFHFEILKEVWHESFILTSSTFSFWGMSRTKALFSHHPLSDVEGCLARKLRFHIFHFHFWRELARKLRFHIFTFHFWRDVSHEMRFWKLADARNVVFCRTEHVSEDGWGSLSGGRVRNTLV